jgi:alpha-1,3-glucan synthase
MRAAALRQSFPISLWKARLETLYHEVSANQQATKTSQWTSQPKTLMFRNIKKALLSKRGFGLTRYLDNAGTTTLHDKFSAKEMRRSGNETAASMADFLGNNSHCLNNVADTFTDHGGEFSATFTNMLDLLTPDNSENELCIEDFLIASERLWFERIRNARFGLPTTRVSLVQWVTTTFWAPKHNGSSRVYTAIKARDSNDLERGHPDVQTHCDDDTFAVTKLQK